MEESTGADEGKNAAPKDSARHGEGMLPERFPGRRRANPQAATPVVDMDLERHAREGENTARKLTALDRRRTDRRGADRRNADRRATDRSITSRGITDRGLTNESTSVGRSAVGSVDKADAQDRRATVWMAELRAEKPPSFAHATEQESCLPSWLCGENGTWVTL